MFDIRFSNEISTGQLLALAIPLLGLLYAGYRWWRNAKPLRLFWSPEGYDVPPPIELDRRKTRVMELRPGVQTVDFFCVASVPWQADHIDVRFVQKRHWWLPNWLWMPQQWYPTDNVFDGTKVTYVKVLTKEYVDDTRHHWDPEPGTVGEFTRYMREKPLFPVNTEIWFRATVEVRAGWSGYLSLRTPFGGGRRIARCRVRVSGTPEAQPIAQGTSLGLRT